MRYFLYYIWKIEVDGATYYESSNEITESTANIIMTAENVSLTDTEKNELDETGDVYVLIKNAGKTTVWMHITN